MPVTWFPVFVEDFSSTGRTYKKVSSCPSPPLVSFVCSKCKLFYNYLSLLNRFISYIMQMVRIIEDFFNLFYPKLCAACGAHLLQQEELVCTQCLYNLPKTNYHRIEENPVEQVFWGRAEIAAATAYFFFEKDSRFAKIIHQLKYRGMKEIGIEMGRIFGAELKETSRFNEVDLIIPVPLHWKKQKKRGYNQSELIASGIAESMGKPIDTDILYRAVETETQTRKSRYRRWENVENIFRVRSADKITGKHILLVDDVITTGSTLESCATTLLKEKNTKVSVATLAMA